MLSDIENLDIMLGGNHFHETEREESLDKTSMRRRESVASNNLENEGESSFSDHKNANVRNEQDDGHQNGDLPSHSVHGMVTGENESPNPVPEFLTGRIPSRNDLDQSYEDINFDTTIPAQERIATAVDPDANSRLADVLSNMQNQPTAQQLTIRPVNSNTMTFDGKSEKFELFEVLFHTKSNIPYQIKLFHSNIQEH